METVVYYYKAHGSSAMEVVTPSDWEITGLFPGADNFDTFTEAEFVEQLEPGPWPEGLKNDDKTFAVSTLRSNRGWIDLQELFYKVADQSAYARTNIESPEAGDAVLRISVDDWCTIWLNGEYVGTLRHERGLETARFPVRLQKGANNLLLKTCNSPATPNRLLWVINCAVEY